MTENWKSYLDAAVEIAYGAGTMLRERVSDVHTVDFKTSVNDLVTEMDRRVEAYVVGQLRSRFPHHAIRAEEGTGADEPGAGGLLWHIDPLDGTNNYFHRMPWFAVSMALERLQGPAERRVVVGVVYNVMADEMFSASLDGGAWMNGNAIHVSREEALDRSLVATGFPYWAKEHPQTLMDNLARVVLQCRDIRRMGSAALDLANVACGRFEAYFEEGVQTWDTGAGTLLVREAGGRVTDYDGVGVAIPTAHVLASNGMLHPRLVEMLTGRHRGALV